MPHGPCPCAAVAGLHALRLLWAGRCTPPFVHLGWAWSISRLGFGPSFMGSTLMVWIGIFLSTVCKREMGARRTDSWYSLIYSLAWSPEVAWDAAIQGSVETHVRWHASLIPAGVGKVGMKWREERRRNLSLFAHMYIMAMRMNPSHGAPSFGFPSCSVKESSSCFSLNPIGFNHAHALKLKYLRRRASIKIWCITVMAAREKQII